MQHSRLCQRWAARCSRALDSHRLHQLCPGRSVGKGGRLAALRTGSELPSRSLAARLPVQLQPDLLFGYTRLRFLAE